VTKYFEAEHYWVTSGPALPCGARKLSDELMGPAFTGTVWLDVCILGQHLPQMFKEHTIRKLTADSCPKLGICSDCFGFGDLNEEITELSELARGVDRLEKPCPNCGGTGRPALRITVSRSADEIIADIRPVPHEYIPPLEGTDPNELSAYGVPHDMCLACGMPLDGTGPHGEELHPNQE
jgi:hypothetical protein